MMNLVEKDPREWLGPILAKLGVTAIEASLSGGGDEGDLNDLSFFDSEKKSMDQDSIREKLKSFSVNDGSRFAQTFYDILEEIVFEDANHQGNYCDNEGGSVWMWYVITPQGMLQEAADFTPGEYDDDEHDDDDYGADEEDPDEDDPEGNDVSP